MSFNQFSALYKFDEQYRKREKNDLVGIDEAGRGPLAGPVVAAAVILPLNCDHHQIKDSKVLTKIQRNKMYSWILKNAIKVETGFSWPIDIDLINIFQATIKSMKIAVSKLKSKKNLHLIDGNKFIWEEIKANFIKKGDSKSLSIAAASIVAKVTRDRLMVEYSKIFPVYGFEKHKGYGTKQHLESLMKYGATPIHRKSFKPVKNFLVNTNSMNNRKINLLGIQLAACHIVHLGYNIFEINNNDYELGNIDLIHKENDEWVFSIVKLSISERNSDEAKPSIDKKIKKGILLDAEEFLQQKGFVENMRFDVILVLLLNNFPQVLRFKMDR